MSEPANLAVRTVDLRVDYEDVHAVRDINLEIPRGAVYGMIGPNGAGKTSTIRVLATLQEPTYGEVFVEGIDVTERPGDVHRLIGYMPDFPPTYEELRVWEFLDLFAAAYYVAAETRARRVDECIDAVNLASKRDTMCKGLSRGMKQRLIMAKTLLHDPPLLILDEPASGLDPMARIELRKSLTALAERGKTVLISSHILTELSGFCTHIGVMESGRLVVSGLLEDVVAQFMPHRLLVVELASADPRVETALNQTSGCRQVRQHGRGYTMDFEGTDDDLAALLKSLVEMGAPVVQFYERKSDVEDVFMKIGANQVS